MQFASMCFARLVIILLGDGSVAKEKVEYGDGLRILGVDITASERGYCCRPADTKVRKWKTTIGDALVASRLAPGDAAKLAGRLSWGCSQMFSRFGRAQLRPIFDQCSRRDGVLCPDLVRALRWWLDVLALDLTEVRP